MIGTRRQQVRTPGRSGQGSAWRCSSVQRVWLAEGRCRRGCRSQAVLLRWRRLVCTPSWQRALMLCNCCFGACCRSGSRRLQRMGPSTSTPRYFAFFFSPERCSKGAGSALRRAAHCGGRRALPLRGLGQLAWGLRLSAAAPPTVVLSPRRAITAQGLPYAINGTGDLLSLFRCISCKYKFCTDLTKPHLMGAGPLWGWGSGWLVSGHGRAPKGLGHRAPTSPTPTSWARVSLLGACRGDWGCTRRGRDAGGLGWACREHAQ